jgi:hypothetical protein
MTFIVKVKQNPISIINSHFHVMRGLINCIARAGSPMLNIIYYLLIYYYYISCNNNI